MSKFRIGDVVEDRHGHRGAVIKIDELNDLYLVEYDVESLHVQEVFIPEELKLAEPIKVTKFDQIKNFTLDEMAEFLHEHTGCACCARQNYDMCLDVGDCKTHIKEWLESEV